MGLYNSLIPQRRIRGGNPIGQWRHKEFGGYLPSVQKSWVQLAALLVAFMSGWSAWSYDETNQTYYPLLTAPKRLYVAAIWNTSNAIGMPADADSYHRAVAMLGSLSGLLLKQGNTNGIFIEANTDHELILRQLAARRAVAYQYVVAPQNPWNLVDRFKASFGNRYVLYDLNANPDSLDVARMASYKFDAIMVDRILEPTAMAHSLTNAFDCSDKDDQWVYTNWWPGWARKDLAVEQVNVPTMGQYRCLEDYATAVGAVSFYDGASTPLRRSFLRDLADDSPVIGWGDFDEISMTTEMSLQSTFLNAANFCYDLALLSSLRDKSRLPLRQKTHSTPTDENNVHHVSFIWTDGDNIQWFHNGFLTATQWFGSTQRGQVPMGWGVSPSMRDLGQTILEQLYDAAANTATGKDFFVAMSPPGYCYPSMFYGAARQLNAQRLGRYMADMDTRAVIFIDNAGFDTPEFYRPYLEQPSIEAIFYWDVLGDYAKYRGAIKWMNGKPIVSARIWMRNVNGQVVGPQEVANDINARPRNPRIPDGYSVVPVHAWSMSVGDIVQCASLLDPAVRIVTPEELVKLVMTNLAPQLPAFSSNPTSQVVRVNGSVSFTSPATGAEPISYQWSLNGNALPGSTSQSLALNGVGLSQTGSYQVVASNAVGAVASSPATLTVQLPNAFPTNCVAAPSGLVNWWSGDGNAYDLIGDSNGSLLGGIQFAVGKVGAAFSFDGINDYVSLPFVASFDFAPANQFTLMAWIRAQPRNQFQSVMVKCPPSDDWDWGIWVDPNNRFMSGLNNQHILTSTTVVQPGVWHHVAVNYANGTWAMYVDGVSQAQASGTYITQSAGSLAFGRKGESIFSPGYFQGAIDEVMIFNRTLNKSEVRALYLAGGNGVCKSVRFSSVSRPADTSIQLTIKGPVAHNYEIQASTDLSKWNSVTTIPNPLGVFSYVDAGTTNFPRRFYRTVIP